MTTRCASRPVPAASGRGPSNSSSRAMGETRASEAGRASALASWAACGSRWWRACRRCIRSTSTRAAVGSKSRRSTATWRRAPAAAGSQWDGATGDVQLRTSGGRIHAENIGGDLSARTSGGAIRISDVVGSVEVRTSGGRIAIDGAGTLVRARTSGGNVSVRFDGAPEGTIETSGGSIEVEIPEESNVDLDARTSGGRVTVEADISVRGVFRANHIEGAVNGGGPPLRLRTSGGNISLEER